MPDMTFVGSMSEITSHSNEKIASELRKTTEEVCEGAKKVVEESQEKKWMNLFKGNRLATQGMTLQYVALLVRNGEIVVELCKTEVELETQKWEHSLIVYVLGLNLPLRHSKGT